MHKKFTNIKKANQHPRKDLLARVNSTEASVQSHAQNKMPCNYFATTNCRAVQHIKLIHGYLFGNLNEDYGSESNRRGILHEKSTELSQSPNDTVRNYLSLEDSLTLDALEDIELPHRYSQADSLSAMGLHITKKPGFSYK